MKSKAKKKQEPAPVLQKQGPGWRDFVWFALVAAAFVAFYWFVCEDSPLHDVFYSRDHIDRRDTPWYFTCGKAWMSGMTPYVDFADSKGPLLWLVYGLAYLISPHDYLGVMLLNGIGYIASLLCMFLTVRLFTKQSWSAALVLLLTIPFLFIPDMHYETKSEDTSFIFMALALWQTCKILYSDDLTDRDWHRALFLWGLCFGGTLMIKYNSSVMLLVSLAFMLVKMYREKRAFWPEFWSGATGGAVIVLPFVIYFLFKGCLWPFIDDYFIQTPQTIANLQGQRSYFMQMLGRHDFVWILVMILAGCGSSALWLEKWKWFPLIVSAWFISLIMYFARGYYIIICGPLMVFIPLCFFFAFKKHKWPNILAAVLMLVIFGFVGWNLRKWYTKEYFGHTPMNDRRERCHKMDGYMASKMHKPRILYYGCADKALGFSSEALPACRYWSLQGGYTKRMGEDQQQCVQERRADFVFIKTDADETRKNRLRDNGYVKVDLKDACKLLLYEKKELSDPPQVRHRKLQRKEK
ncbi:MAG: hypothetical protein IJ795_06800 [Bacteroidales bacterium]|nr:hypothetical protein [Bacteroidales bacterium]